MEKHSFKERLYKTVKSIPPGETLSYKEAARRSGKARAWRSVGQILSKNKNYKDIPCHRVIRSDGTAGGYNKGTEEKIKLLKKEGAEFKS